MAEDQPLFIKHEGELNPDFIPEAMAANGFFLDSAVSRSDSLPDGAKKLLRDLGIEGCLESDGNPYFIYRQKPAPEPLTDEEIDNL